MPIQWIGFGENNNNLPVTISNYVQQCWGRMSDAQKTFTSNIRMIYKFAYDGVNPGIGNTYVCNAIDVFTHTPAGSGTQLGVHESGTNVFCGGHVVMLDGGAQYAQWVADITAGNLAGATRTGALSGSSHYVGLSQPQYEVHLPGLGCVLFGTTGAASGDNTWFQNESWEANRGGNLNPAGWVRTFAHGILGFGYHRATGRQVGAIGTSNYSEKPGAPCHELTFVP